MQVNKILAMLYRAITDRKIRFAYLSKFGLFNKMPDERYLKLNIKMYSAEILIWKIRRRSTKNSNG